MCVYLCVGVYFGATHKLTETFGVYLKGDYTHTQTGTPYLPYS